MNASTSRTESAADASAGKPTDPASVHPASANPAGATSAHAGIGGPTRWWQWALVYPTLLVSVITAAPTMFDKAWSWSKGVPVEKVGAAREQDDIWLRNMTCTSAPVDGLVNEFNVQVDATICKSGDVLVRFFGPGERKSYRWVPVERFDTKLAGPSFISSAVAAPVPMQQSAEVPVCQWSPEAGWVIRRVRDTTTNLCFDERIRTYTGQVTSRTKAACNAPCSG